MNTERTILKEIIRIGYAAIDTQNKPAGEPGTPRRWTVAASLIDAGILEAYADRDTILWVRFRNHVYSPAE